jgi:hypothetical protein
MRPRFRSVNSSTCCEYLRGGGQGVGPGASAVPTPSRPAQNRPTVLSNREGSRACHNYQHSGGAGALGALACASQVVAAQSCSGQGRVKRSVRASPCKPHCRNLQLRLQNSWAHETQRALRARASPLPFPRETHGGPGCQAPGAAFARKHPHVSVRRRQRRDPYVVQARSRRDSDLVELDVVNDVKVAKATRQHVVHAVAGVGVYDGQLGAAGDAPHGTARTWGPGPRPLARIRAGGV